MHEAEFNGRLEKGNGKQFIIFSVLSIGTGLLFWLLLGDFKQTIAGAIFMSTVYGTLVFWKFRVAIAFLGIVLLLLTRTIDLTTTIAFMSIDVIIFLMGMMVIVGMLRQTGFFRWLLAYGLKLSGFEPYRLMIILLFLSAAMASLVDEVTSILFVMALTLDFCEQFKLKPVKYVISVVFATNIGSAWTVIGNPVGILIALRSGLTFEDFLVNAFPIGFVALISIIILVLIWQRDDLRTLGENMRLLPDEDKKRFLSGLLKIENKPFFRGGIIIFITTIVALALHSRLEILLGLEKNTLLVATSIAGAGIVMLWQRAQAQTYIQRDVDWGVLVFFMFLFAKAGTIYHVGLSDVLTTAIAESTGGGNPYILVPFMLWFSGITSALLDNVVAIAALIPSTMNLSEMVGSDVLWWALLFGGCFGGNATMVGSTANIIALGMLEKRTGYSMKLGYWLKIGIFGAAIPMIIATVAMLIFKV